MFLLKLLRATAQDSLRVMREFLSSPPEPESHDGYLREDKPEDEDSAEDEGWV